MKKAHRIVALCISGATYQTFERLANTHRSGKIAWGFKTAERTITGRCLTVPTGELVCVPELA
jgi:hypothetical protein